MTIRTHLAAALFLILAIGTRAQEQSREPVLTRWRLTGGGEVVGMPVKETAESVYVDLGSTILSIPVSDILDTRPVDDGTSSPATGTAPDLSAVTGPPDESDSVPANPAEMVEKAKRSIVLISNPRGAGSGFLLDGEGRIVTNHHVIRNEKFHTVNLFRERDNQWERVKVENVPVEAYSPLHDIAILRLSMDDVRDRGIELHPLAIAAPGSLKVGDTVYAIGNPGMGRRLLEHSVSEGIVSSLSRNFGDVIYIQTTAAVNPGNSGGPLIDRRGRVVGLVTLKAIFQEGIAFALPSALVLHFLENSESFAYSEQAGNKGFRYLSPEYTNGEEE